jgi:hypothetical protein
MSAADIIRKAFWETGICDGGSLVVSEFIRIAGKRV